MNIQSAKKIDLIALLRNLGYTPCRFQPGYIAWYFSPFRDENNPSFKVDTRDNTWHDFGAGASGDTINFIREYHKTDTSGALKILDSGKFGKLLPFKPCQLSPIEEKKSQIKIMQELEIKSLMLLNYIENRKIPLNVARHYCKEIHYTSHHKNYIAIGFINDSGGYELRSPYFKGKSSDAISTLYTPGSIELNIFEGFFDFLAALTHFRVPKPMNTTIILNSTNKTASCKIGKLKSILTQYSQINLYLDNDPQSRAGQIATSHIKTLHPNVKDYSILYKGYKDFSEFIQAKHNT